MDRHRPPEPPDPARAAPPTPTAWGPGRWALVALWALGLGGLTAWATGVLPAPPLAAGLIVLGLAVSVAIGVMSQRCGFFARPVARVPDAGPRLSLTFDDGPHPEFTPRVLDCLARFDQRATFFVIGERAARHPELLRRIVREGHELGNHTLAHRWHTALWPAPRIARDLERAADLIEAAAGVRPTLFRPPAAVLSPRIHAAARRARLRLVGYSTRSGDGAAVVPERTALRRLVRGIRPGAILLLHDAGPGGRPPATLRRLEELLGQITARGLSSVTVSELLGAAGGPGQAGPAR